MTTDHWIVLGVVYMIFSMYHYLKLIKQPLFLEILQEDKSRFSFAVSLSVGPFLMGIAFIIIEVRLKLEDAYQRIQEDHNG